MSTQGNVVQGALKQLGSLDLTCFQSVQQFVEWFIDNVGVIFQASSITNVVVSQTQPTNSQTNQIWFKIDNSGNFIGIFMFSGGLWTQQFPAPQEVIWMYGNSTIVPQGYLLADADNPNISATLATFLFNMSHLDASGLFYDYFPVTRA